MDGPPAQSLGVEPVDDVILRARPRNANDPIVTRALLTRAITSAILIVFLTLKVFANELGESNLGIFSCVLNDELANKAHLQSATVWLLYLHLIFYPIDPIFTLQMMVRSPEETRL